MDQSQLLDTLVRIALAAGAETLPLFRAGTAVERKADASPVTEADRAAERLILKQLHAAFPDVPVVAEESVAAGHIPEIGRRFFLVDPLDGTREFVNGNGDYTVNIALIEDGRPVAGVVHAPARGETYAGAVGLGAFELADGAQTIGAGRPIAVRRGVVEALVAVASRSHSTPETDVFLDEVVVRDRVSVGSSLKFCLVAKGAADVYPRFGRTMEWDTAAGQAVLEAAGGIVVTADGAALGYGRVEQPHDAPFANPFFLALGDPVPRDRILAAFSRCNAKTQ